VPVRHNAEPVLDVCPGGDELTGLGELSGLLAHGGVDLSKASLLALRHTGEGGGIEIHSIEGEGGCARQADDAVRRGCNAERWCHDGRRGRGRKEEHDGGDVDLDGGGTRVRDKKYCVTNVREGRKREKAQRQNNAFKVS